MVQNSILLEDNPLKSLHESDSTLTGMHENSEGDLSARIEEDESFSFDVNRQGMTLASSLQDVNSETSEDKGVRFSQISFRVFYTTLGDNPGCSRGPPLTLEWDHYATLSMNVDDWEEHRPWRPYGSQLKIPWLERRRMMREWFSELEIVAANEDVRRVHVQRQVTTDRQRFEKLEILSQKVLRKMKRAFELPKVASKNYLDSSNAGSAQMQDWNEGDHSRMTMMRKQTSTSTILDVARRENKENTTWATRPVWRRWASDRNFQES